MDISGSFEFISERIFDVYADLLKYGYFTVTAVSRENADVHDLLSFKTFPVQDSFPGKTRPDPSIDFSVVNRKKTDERRLGKQKRRREMVSTFSSLENGTLRDGFRVIGEAVGRARQDISLGRLRAMIGSEIGKTVGAAVKRIDLASEKFEETSLELREMWSSLKAELAGLSIETMTDLVNFGEEAMRIVNRTNAGLRDPAGMKNDLEREVDSAPGRGLNLVLAVVCCLEFVSYCVFLWRKRKATHNFRKVD
jgi:hypothetical protein